MLRHSKIPAIALTHTEIHDLRHPKMPLFSAVERSPKFTHVTDVARSPFSAMSGPRLASKNALAGNWGGEDFLQERKEPASES